MKKHNKDVLRATLFALIAIFIMIGAAGLLFAEHKKKLQKEQQKNDPVLPYRKQSVVGRVTYSYDNRYFIEGSFGYTGSETFAKKNRFGFLPAVGISYFVSNEKFYPEGLKKVMNNLKIRLSMGRTGNDDTGTDRFLYRATFNTSGHTFNQGIGTSATRAATIEKLVQKGFLERKGTKKTKVLLPTDKGKALITVMPEEIQSPEMTADWETKLLQIERGEMEPSEFMTEINTMITELVKNTEMKKGVNALMKNKIIGVCPNCGANVVEREKGWFCESNPCRFVLWKDNAFFKRLGKRLDGRMADKLLRDGRVRLKDCKSAKGKTYNATVLLSTEPDGRSKFSLEFEGGC